MFKHSLDYHQLRNILQLLSDAKDIEALSDVLRRLLRICLPNEPTQAVLHLELSKPDLFFAHPLIDPESITQSRLYHHPHNFAYRRNSCKIKFWGGWLEVDRNECCSDELVSILGLTSAKIRQLTRVQPEDYNALLADSQDGPPLDFFSSLQGRSKAMKGVRRQLVQVAARPADVLLEGETGTGKELAAKGLHMAWNRPGKLVSVNCGSLQPELAGSELFGHKKGAFTGAQYERLGAFVAANKGTLLLDEVNSLSLDTQAFLLRVLQEREITPLGVNFAQPVDIRVICATNVCLEDEVRAKKFREDLYFRINKRVIVIPPLRDRSEDIVGLAVNFLVKIAVHESGPVVQLDPEAVEFLRQQSWPGNVRQLYNVLDRVVDGIGEDLHVAISDIETALQPRQGTNHAPSEGSAGSYGYQERIASFERDQVLLPALQMTGWNVAAAARELRMNRTRLIGRIQKLGLKREG